MTKEDYWNKKKNLLFKDARSYRAFELGVRYHEQRIKELQEELEEWKAEWQEQVQKATDEGYARTQLQIENGKLKKQIEKMKNCFNCARLEKLDFESLS